MAPTPDEFTPPKEVTNNVKGERVVISGMAGLYPTANHVKDLSDILYDKVNPITNNSTRWQYDHPEVAQFTGKVPGLALFDAQFFKVHYRMGNSMDPMARKILEQSYQAIYDAGISHEQLSGKKVGVYIGTCFSESEKANFYVTNSNTGFGIAGCSKTMFANRVSYWLNSKGPSMSVDQACCSSTVALQQAYQAISRGECDSAIVGGANLCLHPHSSVHYGRIMKLSMNGETRSFDTNASGCAKSEAVNVLFLQRAKDALRIYAEVIHVKSEFDSLLEGESGPKYGFYRDPLRMVKFIEQFYEEANVSPHEVEYVEAFGPAVPEVDKVELEVIDRVFCKSRRDPLYVGSIMSNIGYSEAASGISGITKVLLAYQNRKLAGNLNCDTPRQDIEGLRDGRIKIITDHQSFKGTYTAINGLSITGINAHVLLNGHYKAKDLSRYKSNIPHLVAVSARQETSIQNILNDLKSRPIDPEEFALLHNIHKSRISGHLGRGFAILDTDENNQTVCLGEKANYYDDAQCPLWFIYSGMGSQWSGMGAQLMRIPIFAAAIERCRIVLEPKGVDIVHIITSPDKKIFDNILHSFVGIAAIQIGLTDILRALEIFPDKIIGHSVGELGCAYADGCFTAEEMILAAYSRGLVSVQTPFIRGSMAAVGIGYQQISKMCPPEIEVACHNGPDSSTISGPAEIMKEFVETLTKKDIFAKEVPCSNIAYHSRYIAEAGPGLLKYLKEVIPSPKLRSERWVSTSVPQDKWDEPMAKYSSAEYHTNNLLNSVLFEETSKLIPNNAVVVEIAPHGLLQAILKRSLPANCKHIPLTRRGHPDNALFLLEAIGNLFMEGYNPQIQALYPKVEFPVSTGTPMLSHLVEWAHHERWCVSLYETAGKKTGASCKHILSIHDDEHSYLKGHVIRGKNLYPFSGVLVAVWDILCMILNVEKKSLSVQFQDVHIHSHEEISEKKQLKLNISIQRGTGRFEVFNYTNLFVTGFVNSTINEVDISDEESTDDLLYSNDIYQLLNAKGYNYSNDFRTLHNVSRSLTKGQIVWSDNWLTFIDGLIQMNLLKQSGDTVTYPNYIKRITIDINDHSQSKNVEVDGSSTMSATISEVHNWSRAGGLLIEHMQFKDLPNEQTNEIALKTLTFIPHYTTDTINEKAALYAFLQIVAENLNKEEINIVEILDHINGTGHIEKIKNIADTASGLKLNHSYIHRDNILKQSNIFKTTDLLFVNNLSIDDNMCQILHQVLNRDTFMINKEVNAEEMSNKRPSALYRRISAHVIGNKRLELSAWRPSDITSSTSAFSVVSTSDLDSLVSSVPILPSKQRLIILSSYPPVPRLKNLIKEWRTKDNRKINLVMINHDISEKQNLDQMSFSDLSVNILDHGVWGGEYFLPMTSGTVESGEKALEIQQLGNLDTLQWVKASQPSNPGVTVTINYAGINDVEVKTKLNDLPYNNTTSSKKLIEFDFSGKTESGIPVMGVVQEESIRTKVKARPELLWPVPKHWSLEDAATVPLAYVMAFYCLCIKTRLYSGNTILVHGGAGALGQAIISIALAYGCEVFTTVSDTKKKQFLCKVFPELKEDHIGSSRNLSFSDIVLCATKGVGCNIVISCSKGTLKNASLKCCAPTGIVIDTSVIINREDHNFGMKNLFKALSYVTLRLSSLFEPSNIEELKQIQYMMSEGIARGYVRPLTRVTYAPSEVPRAYRLLASSRHRGRVLLNLQKDIPCFQTKIHCQPEHYHLLVSNDEILGIQLVERLVNRGARKLILHFTKQSNCLLLKLRFWKKQGIEVKVSDGKDIANITVNNKFPQNVEGIYYIDVPESVAGKINNAFEGINLLKLQLSSQLKYFAMISRDNENGATKVPLPEEKLLITRVILPMLKDLRFEEILKPDDIKKSFDILLCQPVLTSDQQLKRMVLEGGINYNTINTEITKENNENQFITPRDTVDAIEEALCSKQRVVLGHVTQEASLASLIKDIARAADIEIPNDISGKVTLRELGMNPFRIEAVMSLLVNNCKRTFDEASIWSLTIDSIQELERNDIYEKKSMKGLNAFYSFVDHDELLATTDIITLQTLSNTTVMAEYDFDASRRHLCVIPGLEGHFSRFKTLAERLKMPALVVQPRRNLNKLGIRDMAEGIIKILFKQNLLKDNFVLLGYERGVLIALEMASILESQDLTGTVFCLGGTPDEVKAKFEQELSHLETDEALQEEVLRHMLKLIIKQNPENLQTVLQNNLTFEEKVSNCILMLRGSVSHSIEYAKEIIITAYLSILEMRRYVSNIKPLRSRIVYMRPNDIVSIAKDKQYSQQPIVNYELTSSLATATEDLLCSAIINRHLSEDVLNEFENQNHLESYVINASSFVMSPESEES